MGSPLTSGLCDGDQFLWSIKIIPDASEEPEWWPQFHQTALLSWLLSGYIIHISLLLLKPGNPPPLLLFFPHFGGSNKAFYMLGKHSATQLYSQTQMFISLFWAKVGHQRASSQTSTYLPYWQSDSFRKIALEYFQENLCKCSTQTADLQNERRHFK